MDDDRTIVAAVDTFLLSAVGSRVGPMGSEAAFGASLMELMNQLNLDRWEADAGYGEYLEDELTRFIDRAIDDGQIDRAYGASLALWEQLVDLTELGMQARYTGEVERGRREDLRAPVEEAREAPELSPMEALTERVQAFVQAVKDFVRGRELEDPTQEQGVER